MITKRRPIIVTLIVASFITISGCTDYIPLKVSEGTVIPAGMAIGSDLEKGIQLIPNQYSDILLSVPSINGKKVSGIYITATVTVDLDLSRAKMELNSITFESKENKHTLPITGFISDSNGLSGIKVSCNTKNTDKCGLYILERNINHWNANILNLVDISGVTMMVEKP